MNPTEFPKIEFYRHDLGDKELLAVKDVLHSLFLTTGPKVAQFETDFASLLGVPHCVAVSSCTDGLHLALLALGVGPGDEVITTPLTFVATPNSVLYTGATPVFVDVDPSTGALDLDAVEAAITPRTKVIMPVHLYGHMVDMRKLRGIADRHGLAIVEDSAHGVEMTRDGIHPGQLSEAAVFSFYATKTLACGDGGAVVVRDPALDRKLRRLRSHGITRDAVSRYGELYKHWDMEMLGYKAGLTDIQAAILLAQLDRLEMRRASREACVLRYMDGLKGIDGVDLLRWNGTSSQHLFTFLAPAERRDELLARLGEWNVGVAVNYRAVHLLSYYRERFGYQPGSFPHAESVGDRTVSLPLWPGLPLDQVDHVVGLVQKLFRDGPRP